MPRVGSSSGVAECEEVERGKGERKKGNPPEEKGEKRNSVFWNFRPLSSHRFHPLRYTEMANPLGLVRQQKGSSSP